MEHLKKAHRNLTAPPDSGPQASKEEKQSFKIARVCQAHWLTIRSLQHCADVIDRRHRGWLVHCKYGKAVKSACLSLRLPNGDQVVLDSPVVIPDRFSRPNAANALVQVRDLVAHYLRQDLTR